MKGAANTLGAKTARACDSCLRRRARWFCGADDAFLCHACDNLVHSANQLASRHERVRLQTASTSSKIATTTPHQAWHSGFTRKARTPRHNNNNKHLLSHHHHHQQQHSKHEPHHEEEEEEEEEVLFIHSCLPVVPELGSEDAVAMDESEEQLLCRVPEFDAFETELCGVYGEIGDERLGVSSTMVKNEEACDLDNFSEFLESDMDLAEFAADVESLLESGLADESGAQLFDCKQEDGEIMESYVGVVGDTTSLVKIKDEQQVLKAGNNDNINNSQSSSSKGKIFLRLNYEDVISAWASQGCPWTTGNPPQLNSDDSWSDCLGWSSTGEVDGWCYGEVGRLGGQLGSGSGGDSGREARVTRYREKRRTRLFAKKIRYEVRKLNAEKRPRMKGRFVKRASFVGASNSNTALPHAAAAAASSR